MAKKKVKKKTNTTLASFVYTSSLVVFIIAGVLSYKYFTSREMFWPLPYQFSKSAYIKQKTEKAPILILGDRLGARFVSYKKNLAHSISSDLMKDIKIDSLAHKGEGIHRSIERLEKIDQLPLIIIYMGGSEEFLEKKYHASDMSSILTNIKLFKNIYIQSALMVFPPLSRFIYLPVSDTVFDEKPEIKTSKYTQDLVLKQNEIDYNFYQFELTKLARFAKDRNAIFITITAPINLEAPPKKSCDKTIDKAGSQMLEQVVGLVKEQDYKGAYRISKDLVLLAPSNAKSLYLHGKVAKQLGKYPEAKKYLELAASFDCERWRATPVHNAIMRKVAKDEDIVIYDFHEMLYSQWTENVLFADEIYPQTLYFEKMISTLAGQLKKRLKL